MVTERFSQGSVQDDGLSLKIVQKLCFLNCGLIDICVLHAQFLFIF